MIGVLAWSAALLFSGQASAAPQADSEAPAVLIKRRGRYADGMEVVDRFEITDDQIARWDSASAGGSPADPLCRNEGGRFERPIPEAQALKIVDAAREAIASQGNVGKAGPQSPRDTVLTVTVFKGKEFWSSNIEKTTPAWLALEALVGDAKRSLLPRGTVLMRSKLKGKSLQVTFDWFGDRPLSLVLSKDPNEVFRAPGVRFSYERALDQENFVLSKKRRRVEVRLRTEPVRGLRAEGTQGPRHLNYANTPLLHHRSADPLEGHLAPEPLDLCATY